MHQPTYILGGYQTDFAERWRGDADGLYELIETVALGAVEDAGVPASDIQAAHVGNLAAELFTGQAHLGGMVASVYPEWAGLPTARHEAACASGSVATLAATAELEAGRYDLVLVIGVELMRNVSGEDAANHLGSAAWIGREATDARWPWPALFSRIADEYGERYGLDGDHLLHIAETNIANARNNPFAQTRDWQFGPDAFTADDDANPVIEGRLRKQDCGRITDGAAAIVLASPRYAATHGPTHGLDLEAIPRIEGWGTSTSPMLLEPKLEASRGQPYVFPHLRRAIVDAFERAAIEGVSELDAIETHDCFTISEYAAIDHFGITAPGESWKAIEDGTITMDGALPVNPSGGLIGLGHPVGATGVRMLLDASRQVSGRAGDTQVGGAQRVATLNIGGSFTTAASFIVGAS